MDCGSAFDHACSCGRSFSQAAAFKNHQNSCKRNKKRLSLALAKAKEALASRKRKATPVAIAPPVHAEEQAAPEFNDVEVPTCAEVTVEPDQSRPNKRCRKLPAHLRAAGMELHDKRLKTVLPEPLPALPPPGIGTAGLPSTDASIEPATAPPFTGHSRPDALEQSRMISLPPQRVLETGKNSFGLFRRYRAEKLPSHDPEGDVRTSQLSDIVDVHAHEAIPDPLLKYGPFPNRTSFLLGDWYWNRGAQKSQQDFKELLNIIAADDFRPADVRETNWGKINKQLADEDWDDQEWMDEDAGWKVSPVYISVPFDRHTDAPGPREYRVSNLYHRSLVGVIREKLSNSTHHTHFHHQPYELRWQPNDRQEAIRVYGELYTSSAFLDAHAALQESPREPNCDLERVVVALMFWSDATQLTNFGNAKLWPLYLFFGNDSKYRRCKPSCSCCEHVAYFEGLPDSFKDFVNKYSGTKKTKPEFYTHCRRECLHAQWTIILDDEFLDAYEHGIKIECCDGVYRRFYPRIFTYSADYPEKVILACIRNLGMSPCPRCVVQKSNVHRVGTKRDRNDRIKLHRVDDEHRRFMVSQARDFIYHSNNAVNSAGVEHILKAKSWVPTTNAFSTRLSKYSFDFHSMLVIDLMHEIEIGTWKALFMHLLRILESFDEASLHELDRRFRLIPTFGRDTIRRFSSNTSELKRLAARDYEDFLQCVIPVFQDLLPEPHNGRILRLLFTFAHWHGLAKLRMHTDATLSLLDDVTTQLGQQLRSFQKDTCSYYQTYELKREAEARKRRQSRQESAPSSSATGNINRRQPKKLNLQTYKVHAIGDYVSTIKMFGTTDSYTTAIGELEHRSPKSRYRRTSRKNFVQQLAHIERRQARIKRIRQRIAKASSSIEDVPQDPNASYEIGQSEKHPVDIGTFLRSHTGDPATKDFWPRLKAHLLPRIQRMLDAERQGHDYLPSGSRMETERAEQGPDGNGIHFKGNRMYRHNIMRLNYTTYDVRRAQDTINPKTDQRNIMLLSPQDRDSLEHQYDYACVLGIYHVNVIYTGPGMSDYKTRRMDFLWVRWYDLLDGLKVEDGWKHMQLDRLHFLPITEEGAFGFVDPAHVLRASHLIQSFAMGRRHIEGGGISACAQNSNDWHEYFVNRFVDRDMVMRFHWGLAVGHVYAHDASQPYIVNQVLPEDDGAEEDVVDTEAAHIVAQVIPKDDTAEVDIDAEHDETEGTDETDSSNDSASHTDREDYPDDDLLAMHEMYGYSQNIECYE